MIDPARPDGALPAHVANLDLAFARIETASATHRAR
jgi:hypothetical protein